MKASANAVHELQPPLPLAAGKATEKEEANLFLRHDTIFGVCEALGEDFGFNPLWLRIALCAGLFFNASAVIAGYLAIGSVVALSRWLFPKHHRAVAVPTPSFATVAKEQPGQDQERELIAA